jgi:N-acetylneuraminate epimerase
MFRLQARSVFLTRGARTWRVWSRNAAWAFAASLLMTVSCVEMPAGELRLKWTTLAPVPDGAGLGGAYGGTSGNALIVAGGSNFPDKMPWEGGIKAWLQEVYVLEKPGGQWKSGYKLPLPGGYGVSASVPEGLVCAGGSGATAHFEQVFLLEWKRDGLEVRELPPLPVPLAYSCGAALNGSIYVAGGTDSPTATNTRPEFLRLDMKDLEKGWQKLPTWPGAPRMLATAAAMDGSFYLVGGTDLYPDQQGNPARTYLKDGFKYTPGQGWRRIKDMPNPVVAAPSPAPVLPDRSFLVVGGDDGSLVNFEPRSKHPGFPKRVLRYHSAGDNWTVEPDAPVSRATLPTAEWNGMHVLLSGEARPGVRSPEVWAMRPDSTANDKTQPSERTQ